MPIGVVNDAVWRARIVAQLHEGLSLAVVAERHGLSICRVSIIRKEAKIPKGKRAVNSRKGGIRVVQSTKQGKKYF